MSNMDKLARELLAACAYGGQYTPAKGKAKRLPIDWPTIDPILGTMTDAALSKQTGVPELTILRRRKRLGVRSFAHQRSIDGAVNPLPRFVEKGKDPV